MAKTDTQKPAAEQTLDQATPALGTTCTVQVAAGVVLMNNETGTHFAPEAPTPVTVTVTLLRRLQDGDLALVG